ncbi:MAG: ABC transporter ATP-binding protein/permease [Proteobacteria bacterium]|nr:ABC transporter ATP-binding protein/permease [Pseudomonadota bacterium]MBU1688119.1 ABC transporter ATP-binding protein/permease [Pseudomonadota bacterium]
MKRLIPSREQIRRAKGALSLVLPSYRKYRLRIMVGFLALLAVDLLQVLIPRIIKGGVDDLQQGIATNTTLLRQGGMIIGLALAIALFRFSWRQLILGFSRKLERDIRNRLLDQLMALDRTFFNHHPTGEIMALSSNDLSAVQMAAGIGLVSFVDAIFMTAAALICMVYIHPALTAIALSPMPILALLTGLLSAVLHQRFTLVQEQFGRITEMSRSTLSSIRLIKAYTQEEDQIGRLEQLGQAYIQDNLRLAMVQGGLWPFSTLIASSSLLLVVFFGGRLTITGAITIGDFVAFMTYLALMTWPMMAVGWVANLFQRGITALDRIDRVIKAEAAIRDPISSKPIPQANLKVECRDLTFRYGPNLPPILQRMQLSIGPGLTGIVGRTGSGKTTLCRLLARIYPVADHSIYWSGIDCNQLSLATVRSHLAYVPQSVILFSDTIEANIRFGRPEASPEEVENAARAAAIHEEILSFPQGYASRVGEKGVLLSGGQRQRIALARALLMDRPVVIIDDGLSAVDTDTEHRIIANYGTWLPGRICIIVSHRVIPVMGADQIIVLDQGRIAAQGTHQELLAANDYYRTIVHHQVTPREGGKT